MAVNAQKIRMAFEAGTQDAPHDISTSSTPVFWNGTNLDFQIGLFDGSSLMDISYVDSITLEVKDANSKTALPYMSVTLASDQLDNTVTSDTWADGSQQHAVISFAASETVLPLTADSTTFWMVVSAMINKPGDAEPHQVVFGAGAITCNESGYDQSPPSSVSQPTYLTAQQSDARYAARLDNTQRDARITSLELNKMAASGGTFTGAVALAAGVKITIPSNGLKLTNQISGPTATGSPRVWVQVTGIGASNSTFYLPLYQ